MRAGTAVNLKYWQIKEDFEAEKIPMKILLPSSSLKDHVGDRWTFIGEDGLRELKEYLEPRLPLEDEDYVFASEKKGRVKGEQFSVASLSVKFGRIASKLELTKPKAGKPKRVRMHGLRKYFRNNMRADSAYIKFWMGHSLGVDAHYITRDPERHRKEYKKGYEFLRIFEPSLFSVAEQTQRITQLEKKLEIRDQEIRELKEKLTIIDEWKERMKFMEEAYELLTTPFALEDTNALDAILAELRKKADQINDPDERRRLLMISMYLSARKPKRNK